MRNKIKQKYNKIHFNEEQHSYRMDDDDYISVTSLIKQFYPSFDPTGELTAKCALKKGISPREMAEEWTRLGDIAKEKGTEIHLLAQEILEGTYTYPSPIKPEITAKIRLLSPLCEQIKPDLIACEQIIYNQEFKIAGTIDLLTLDEQGFIEISDWKSNRKPIQVDKYWEMMLEPLNTLPANDYHKYALQLSLYRYLLECDGFKCSTLRILHIKDKEIEIMEIPYLKEEVEMILNERKQSILQTMQ